MPFFGFVKEGHLGRVIGELKPPVFVYVGEVQPIQALADSGSRQLLVARLETTKNPKEA